MNKVVMMGRLVADPKISVTRNELTVAKFTIALDRGGKDKGADFAPCTAFGKTAELIGNYFKKGQRILIDGRFNSNTYETSEGGKRTAYGIIVDHMEFTDSKKSVSPSQVFGGGMKEVEFDEEVPF